MAEPKDKSLESWIWDAACSIRGAKDAPKCNDYVFPQFFANHLGEPFDYSGMHGAAVPEAEGTQPALPKGRFDLVRNTKLTEQTSAQIKVDPNPIRLYLPLAMGEFEMFSTPLSELDKRIEISRTIWCRKYILKLHPVKRHGMQYLVSSLPRRNTCAMARDGN